MMPSSLNTNEFSELHQLSTLTPKISIGGGDDDDDDDENGDDEMTSRC